jgi:hypothetical protein
MVMTAVQLRAGALFADLHHGLGQKWPMKGIEALLNARLRAEPQR